MEKENVMEGFGAVMFLSGKMLMKYCTQVLAVDLLNPTPAAEARKHKLKVWYLYACPYLPRLPSANNSL